MILLRSVIYNCQQATLLALKKQSGKIGLAERFRLSIHLRYCESCKRFVHQSSIIDSTVITVVELLDKKPVFQLSETAKLQIQELLKNP
jgi:hypothetical protein